MSNGSVRLALSEMELAKQEATAEQAKLLEQDKSQGRKMPLKSGASEHNHSK